MSIRGVSGFLGRKLECANIIIIIIIIPSVSGSRGFGKKNINRKLIEVATTPTTTIIANEGVEEQHAIESLHQDGQTLK